MKKIFSALTLLAAAASFSAHAYNCPANLYFYVSNDTKSTAFTKNQTVFTYTVDATAADVYGVIVNTNATSWDSAKSNNGYFPQGRDHDIEVSSTTSWGAMTEWTGSTNNHWGEGCYKFVKGNKYDIKLVYANNTFTGTVTVQGQTGGDTPITPATKYDTTKDYYINASACTWFFDGDAVIKVWDGENNVVCENIGGGILKFRPSAEGTEGIAYVKRVNPNNDDETWNEYGMVAPTNAAHNLFTITSDFKGGTWSTYESPKAWLISEAINGWSAAAISKHVLTLDEATGIYTITVPADDLRGTGDGDGFKIGFGALNDWENYYGAPGESAVTIAKGIEINVVKNAQNIVIPETATSPVTITFNLKTQKLKVDWDVTPVDPDPVGPIDSDDLLVVNLPKMDINGETLVEVTLQAPADKQYCSAQWDIVVPASFTASDVTLNKERCTDHELVVNEVNGVLKCAVYSSKNTPFVQAARPLFSFKLKANNASVGEVKGSLNNIRFNEVPKEGNLNIANIFEDTPLNIEVVKAVSKITANPNAIALNTGESKDIAITVEPADASDKTYSWQIVSGDNVITLANGKVTAKASGIAVIKVTANDGFGASAEINVTVGGKKVETITLSAEEHTMYVGETTRLTATVGPESATNKGVMWTSSNYNVATVSDDGVVTGVGAGEATISAIAKDGSGVQASCVVTVKAKVSGDADGDDELTIADIVIIAKKSVDIDTEGALLENMDMDRDGVITTTDVTLAVYYLNQQAIQSMPKKAQMSTNGIRLTTPVEVGSNSFNVPIYLNGARNVAGVMFDVVMPNGLSLSADDCYVSAQASNDHSISVTEIAPNTYRVVIYSAYNFNHNDLGYINVKKVNKQLTTFDVDLNNVMYSDGNNLIATDDSRHTLEFISTGISSVFADDAVSYDIYDVNGICVMKNANKAAAAKLPAGIYIINGTKVIL